MGIVKNNERKIKKLLFRTIT